MKPGEKTLIPDEIVINKIYFLRGKRVMIDRELADLYGVETKRLKEAVRRNIERFPDDFMFEMTQKEFGIWRSQFASSKSDKMGLRHTPFCFTEQGVTMLSCILNSTRAIAVNIQIVRIFTKMRELLVSHKDILIKLERLESRFLKHDQNLKKHENEILLIFQTLKRLLNPHREPRKKTGYRISENAE